MQLYYIDRESIPACCTVLFICWLVFCHVLADKKQKEINTITQIARNDGFPLDIINHLNNKIKQATQTITNHT